MNPPFGIARGLESTVGSGRTHMSSKNQEVKLSQLFPLLWRHIMFVLLLACLDLNMVKHGSIFFGVPCVGWF